MSAPAEVAPGIDPGRVKSHLFVVPQNNSGSTFLTGCLHACRRVIALPSEGQHVPGFRGPVPRGFGDHFVWGRPGCRTGAVLATDELYDWGAIRRAWYGVAVPAGDGADVFVEKSPPNVARTALLDRHFPGARFLFLVRDPFALAESVVRQRPNLPDATRQAGEHVVTTFRLQRDNVANFSGGGRGVLVRYEDLCDSPVATEDRLRAWAPELDDLCVRRRIPVKGRYDQDLTNLNGDHHARLQPRQRDELEAVFAPHADLLAAFRYAPVLEAPDPEPQEDRRWTRTAP
jgi:hypothetical protein